MKLSVVDMNNKKVGDLALEQQIFGTAPNKALIYESVKNQLINRRQGTSSSRNTDLVHGSTAKIYRQKGTGQARHGSRKANIFVGGGVAFGPKPRDYTYTMPKKAKRGALRAALALKQGEKKLHVIDVLEFSEMKTKQAVAFFKKLEIKKVLIVADNVDEKVKKSVRNIEGVKVVSGQSLNVLDLCKHEDILFTKETLEKIQERLVS